MDSGYLSIDLDKIQTIEEVKAVLKLSLMVNGKWDGEHDIVVSNNIVNTMPILTNLVKEKNT